MRTLAVDPSINSVGFAMFDKHGTLEQAFHLSTRGKTDAERLMSLASETSKRAYDLDASVLVVEYPHIYPQRGKNKIDPNSILKLTMAAGTVVGSVVDLYAVTPVLYKPSEWKGSMDKQAKLNRIEREVERRGWRDCLLSFDKLSKRGKGDVLDAVGIGLYHLEGWK
jgi:hypothetical protein